MTTWAEHLEREQSRYEDGVDRLPDRSEADAAQRALTRLGNAAAGAGLALLMAGHADEAGPWFARAAERYRESFAGAPPGSWGRLIGALKARILASDWRGAEDDARWALEQDPGDSESPIGRYAATLALLVLERDHEARALANTIREREDFPDAVGDALATIAAEDRLGYIVAVERVLESFETREEYLEDLPVADTVLVLQALAARRELTAELTSQLLPGP